VVEPPMGCNAEEVMEERKELEGKKDSDKGI
jgi:hypothetical protein